MNKYTKMKESLDLIDAFPKKSVAGEGDERRGGVA